MSGAAKPRRPGSTGRGAPAWRAGQYSNILKNVGMSGKGGGSGVVGRGGDGGGLEAGLGAEPGEGFVEALLEGGFLG